MVKKVNQGSLQITKVESKKQLNNLIKVLRPKVYITDTSNFKRLVQELTGNGSSVVISTPAPTIQIQRQELQDHPLENRVNVPVINVEEGHGESQSSMEAISSFDTSLDSFGDDLFKNVYFPEVLFTELADSYHQVNNLNHEKSRVDAANSMDQWADWLACQDIESWLLDIDHQRYPNFDGFAKNQEVSVYDYEFSGLLS